MAYFSERPASGNLNDAMRPSLCPALQDPLSCTDFIKIVTQPVTTTKRHISHPIPRPTLVYKFKVSSMEEHEISFRKLYTITLYSIIIIMLDIV